jgi:bifunctional DNA-binding transcriptional regulator/antitoxin component of YhaV-PrlF toxin-antitoxin module
MDQHVTMAANGRIVIPAKLCSQLGMEGGDTFLAQVENGAIRLMPLRVVIGQIQANVRRYVPEGCDLSGELSRDRRRDAADEWVLVLDASAVLALMNAEPGEGEVAAVLADAVLGAVNLAEVVSKLAERGMPAAKAHANTLALGLRIAAFDAILARMANVLRPVTRAAGPSPV